MAPYGSKIVSVDVFTAARDAESDKKRKRQEGMATTFKIKFPAGSINLSPSVTVIEETYKTVFSPGDKIELVLATKRRCLGLSETLAMGVSEI